MPLLLMLSVFHYKKLIALFLKRKVLVFYCINLFFIVYLWTLHAWKGDTETALVTAMMSFLILTLTAALLLAVFLEGHRVEYIDFLKLIHLVLLVQSVFIIFSFISPPFKQLVAQYIPYSEASNLTDESFRARGLTNGSGATLSLLQSLNLFFTLYLYQISNSKRYSIFLMVSFGVIVISLLPVGRTGLLALIFTPFLFRNMLGGIKTILIGVVALGVSFILFKNMYLFFSSGGVDNQFGVDIFERMMSWFTGEFKSSSGVSSTADALLTSHIVFNDLSLLGILFGDPNIWTGYLRIKGDIGYVRIFNSSGLIGSVLFYGMFFYLFRHLIKINPSTNRLFLAMGLFLFFTDMKEPFLYKQEINGFLVLLFAASMTIGKKCNYVK